MIKRLYYGIVMLLAICACVFAFGMTAYAETTESDGERPSDSVGMLISDKNEGDQQETDGTDGDSSVNDEQDGEPSDTQLTDTDVESTDAKLADADGESADTQLLDADGESLNEQLTDADTESSDTQLTDVDGELSDTQLTDGVGLSGDTQSVDEVETDETDPAEGKVDGTNILQMTGKTGKQNEILVAGDSGDPDDTEEDGWHEEETGEKYYIENGERVHDVRRKIDGIWWDFDSDGHATEVPSVIVPGQSQITEGDRIWFMNVAGGAFYSDFLLVESDGKWGLIDSGHRYSDVIEDEDGTIYSVPFRLASGSVVASSCQMEGRNGRDIAIYLIETLGVDHIDFILGSHSHSDHCGGIPEIAELLVDKGDTLGALIDEATIYLKKAYYHINTIQDDLGTEPAREDGWHTQAFDYQARKAVLDRGGTVIDITNGIKTSDQRQFIYDYSKIINQMEQSEALSDVTYSQGDLNDYYDDYLQFTFGKMQFRLYNLYTLSGNTKDDNPDSIAAVITCNGTTLFSGGDLNVMYSAQQKVAQAVHRDYGTIDILKSCHHGTSFSSCREFLDLLQPKVIITTGMNTSATSMNTSGVYWATLYYSKTNYGTYAYEVGPAEHGVVLEFKANKYEITQVKGRGETAELVSADELINRVKKDEGLVTWVQVYDDNGKITDYYYFKDGVPATGWQDVDGSRYYFKEDGLAYKGWFEENGKKYYFTSTAVMKKNWLLLNGDYYYFNPSTGEMVTGWVDYKNEKYYLDQNGVMCKGFAKINGKGYFFEKTGEMFKGWKVIDGNTYYFGSDGSAANGWLTLDDKTYFFQDMKMKTGWIRYKSNWYYCESSGNMKIGSCTIDGKLYLFENDGKLADKGWKKVQGIWYFITADGAVATNWRKIGNKWYFMEANGAMVTGWRKIDKVWYFFDSNGAMKTGWVKDKGRWYLMDENGVLSTGWKLKNGVWYFFNSSGAMVTGWKKAKSKWYYLKPDGGMAVGWKKVAGIWYYFDADGVMATGTVQIGNTKYRFRSDGKWVGNVN